MDDRIAQLERELAEIEDGDSDAWMRAYAGESDDPLEVELAKREAERRERRESTGGGFGGEDDFSGAKKNGDADGAGASADPLAAMAERLRAFMGERSGHEGVEDALALAPGALLWNFPFAGDDLLASDHEEMLRRFFFSAMLCAVGHPTMLMCEVHLTLRPFDVSRWAVLPAAGAAAQAAAGTQVDGAE